MKNYLIILFLLCSFFSFSVSSDEGEKFKYWKDMIALRASSDIDNLKLLLSFSKDKLDSHGYDTVLMMIGEDISDLNYFFGGIKSPYVKGSVCEIPSSIRELNLNLFREKGLVKEVDEVSEEIRQLENKCQIVK